MKKAPSRKSANGRDELRPEYRFDYSKAKPNRFANRMSRETIAVVLDPDVSVVFKTSEAVNNLLRSAITAVKPPRGRPDGKVPSP